MRERILAPGRRARPGDRSPWAPSTALCARVLRRDGSARSASTPRFTIYDTDDQTGLIKQVLRELELAGHAASTAAGRAARPSARWKNDIDRAGRGDRDRAHGLPTSSCAARAYAALRRPPAQGAAPSTSTTCWCSRCPPVRGSPPRCCTSYQERYRYVLVDEYQDEQGPVPTGAPLAEKYRNLTVVGDDPRVYGWRGADVRNMMAFEEDFPEPKVDRLEQNYRSTKTILDVAQAVITPPAAPAEEALDGERQGGPSSARRTARRRRPVHDPRDREARPLRRPGGRSVVNQRRYRRDVAVMYRTNAQSRALEEALVRPSSRTKSSAARVSTSATRSRSPGLSADPQLAATAPAWSGCLMSPTGDRRQDAGGTARRRITRASHCSRRWR